MGVDSVTEFAESPIIPEQADSHLDVSSLIDIREKEKRIVTGLEQQAEGLLIGYDSWMNDHAKELMSLSEDNFNADPFKHGDPNKCIYVSADGQKREVYFVNGRLFIVNPDDKLIITIPAPIRYETLAPEKLHTRPTGQESGFKFTFLNSEDSSGFFLSTKDSITRVWKKPNIPDPLQTAADNLGWLQDPGLKLESSTPFFQT